MFAEQRMSFLYKYIAFIFIVRKIESMQLWLQNIIIMSNGSGSYGKLVGQQMNIKFLSTKVHVVC